MGNVLSKAVKRYLFGNISDNEVRERMYDNLLPWGYHTPIKRVRKTVKRNQPEHRGNVYGITDDVFAEYLQIPKNKRREPVLNEYLVTSSKYKPQKSSENKLYKTIQGLHMDTYRGQSIRDEIINKAPKTIGENVVTSTQNLMGPFGDFTIGRGFDDRGEYVSYYDSYDINPFKGRFRSSIFNSKKDDLTFGIGNPTEYYDRVYLDDYYDIPEEARGKPFITPAVVTAYKKGGRIHIKKKNRGKFTEYCGGKVTEECIAKGKKSKDPKIRKRATFAANARKWKHENGGIIRFQPGGTVKLDDYGYPADITPAVVTQDPEFNKFLMTLPDNLRLTPEKEYYLYKSWNMNGRPRNFQEGLEANMYNWDDSDNSYHGVTVIGYDENGVGIFGKPKHHDTVHYELDWYNKGIGTLEGGKQYPLQGEERKEWEDFKSQYQLDSTGVDYKYVPIKKNGGILKALDYAKYITKKPAY